MEKLRLRYRWGGRRGREKGIAIGKRRAAGEGLRGLSGADGWEARRVEHKRRHLGRARPTQT